MARVSLGYGMSYENFFDMTRIPITKWQRLRPMLDAYLAGTANLIIDNQVITGHHGLAELFVTVGDGYSEHILMFPTHTDKLMWHFRNDLFGGIEDEPGPDNTQTEYLDGPIEPYDIYMDRNGVEISSPGGDPALRPGIPEVMRDWLIRYKVFDLSGVAKLRPMMVEWGNC